MKEKSQAYDGGGDRREQGWGSHSVAIRISFLFLLKNFQTRSTFAVPRAPALREEILVLADLRSGDVLGARRWKLCFINLTAPSQESLKF